MSQTTDSPPTHDEEEIVVIDDWSDATQELIDTLPKTWTRGLLYFLAIFVAIALPWAVFYSVDETGTARGRLEPKNATQRLDAPASGTVIAVRAKEGDTVKRNQVILELESDLLRNELEQAQDKLEGQQNRLSQLESQKNAFTLALNTQKQQNQAQLLEKDSQIDRAEQEISTAINNAPLQDQEKQAQVGQAQERLSAARKNLRLQEQEKLSQIAQAREKLSAARKNLILQEQEKLSQVEQARQRLSNAQANLSLQPQEKTIQIEQAQARLSAAQETYILATNRLNKERSELERYRRLLAEGVVAQVKVVEIEQRVDESQRLQTETLANIKFADKQLQEQQRSYQILVSQLQSEIEQAQKQFQEQQRSYNRLISQLQSEIKQAQNQLEEQQRSYQTLMSQLQSEIQQTEKQLEEQNRSYQRITNQTDSEVKQAQNRSTQEKRGYETLKKGGELAIFNNQKQIQELVGQITSLEAEMTQSQNEIKSLKLQLQQRTLRAPSNGIITEMPIEEPKAYLQAGQLVAQIAPQNTQLILRAQMPSDQSGFLKVGLPVKVKFDAYPFQDYGIVLGKVIWVSPDTKVLETPQGKIEVFQLEVGLDRTYITNSNKRIDLNPGQTASAEVIIRQRRIIDFIIDPFKKLQQGDLKL
ncbi:HlyD family efflux transporter periplasmic adaptor subunit [Merismopedia glauca]|uniref:Hemolysin D n=1 Tax=Merismopedia glauca CCAP 1448/3 TaxID=1296344 RepID=A0A2T1BWN1_9CYAN|nr:HlyD family efflux transporter periplasmic adaptor subunit [Merismopedia glauca]PSB00358.1 hemolysin D [Merismopedia glauca CCAP 1448/3]